MTYKTICKADGSCVDRIDSQAATIKAYQDEINRLRTIVEKKETALAKAVVRITKLEGEKKHVTDTLNLTSRELAYYRADYVRRPHPVGREDANWDSRPREESWEL